MTHPGAIVDRESEAPAALDTKEVCASCGRALDSHFCPECGERRASDRHYSLAHFGEEIAETFTHADGTLWRTFKALILRPGELTAAYMRGERVRYMKPLSLFLMISVAYFLGSAFFAARTFDTPLRVHLRQSNYAAIATRMVTARLAQRKISLESYETTFDKAATAHAKTLVIVMVPAFAIVVGLVEIRRRKYMLQHLIFSLHTYTYLLVLSIVVDSALMIPVWLVRTGRLALRDQQIDNWVSLLVVAAMGVYYARALRRAYGDGRVGAVLKALVLVVAMGVALFAYRAFLFFVTYWTT